MAKKWSFCHGVYLSPYDYSEIRCERRDHCAYYDVEFYRKHGHHLDEFEDLFPIKPCPFFVSNNKVVEEAPEVEKNAYNSFLKILGEI